MMANRPNSFPSGGNAACSNAPGRPTCAPPGLPIFTEPETRRWPHPLERVEPPAPPSRDPGDALAELRCVLTRQTQLLSEIKALLEQLTAPDTPEQTAEK